MNGRVRAYILLAINALHNKGFGHMRLYCFCRALQMGCEYCASLQTSILSITRCSCTSATLCVKFHLCEFVDCLDHEFLNRENFYSKANGSPFRKIAPREHDPLYGNQIEIAMTYNNSGLEVKMTHYTVIKVNN